MDQKADAAVRMDAVNAVLAELVEAAKAAFGDELVSVVLFGSAAEGRLRASSDVNLLMLLKTFDASRIDGLRDALRVAHAAAGVEVMFLLEDELPAAAGLFAAKFDDIRRRHRVLHGSDPIQALAIDQSELRRQLRETLLNLAIRLRASYAKISLREEQLAPVLADVAGPLRAAAATALQLQGRPAASPAEALEALATADGDPASIDAVNLLHLARRGQPLPAGAGGPALLALSRLAARLLRSVEAGA